MPVRRLRWLILVLIILIALPYLLTPLYLVVRPVSTLMLWRWMRRAPVERVWMPLNAIAPALPLAVIAAEDGQFCRHHGIDLGGLREAIDDAEDFSDLRGGSTITQQVAKIGRASCRERGEITGRAAPL